MMTETPQSQGFMLYADDWTEWTSDYTNEEIGEMLVALLNYFSTGEVTAFSDRGMKQFYRQGMKSIDRDRERYADKCLQNAYNRYRGICKKNETDPLDYEEWLTTVNDRQEPSTVANDQTTKADETDQLQQKQKHTTETETYNRNRSGKGSAEGETAHDSITEALEANKITPAEAVALRLKQMGRG